MAKEPIIVHCGKCSHEWPAAYAPMDMAAFAKTLKRATCPNCGESKKIFLGAEAKEVKVGGDATVERRFRAWLASHDCGVSSKAIAAVMRGEALTSTYCHPHDSSDFGRCYRLLKLIPEWRERIGEMARVSAEWKALSERWPELEALNEKHAECTTLIRSIVRPLENKRPNLVRFGDGATIVFGR